MSNNEITKSINLSDSISEQYDLEQYPEAKVSWSTAYSVLGNYYEFGSRNMKKAIRYYTKAIELNPNDRELQRTFNRINFGG